ncbi:S1 family peptidase [Actinophytocola oryzae]|uniref:Trypsin-like peptidase n=1 Tax=Actinophytocola oryzae TaxID=502181 RepID=A0A4R7VAU8_9PSEU|nr:serine protease [Actinophytocola oryzae]TDV46116.1 trypsin-like peptidase [Actinophytocola oryzae]
MIRVAVALLLLSAGQPASPEVRAAAIAQPAVVHVSASWQGWVRDARTGEVFGGAGGYTFTSSCSGAVVDGDGYVATAGHCVDGDDGLIDMAVAELASLGRVRDRAAARQQLADNAVVEGARTGSPVTRRVQVERATGTGRTDVAPASVVGVAAEGDVAVLKVPRSNLPALEVTDADVAAGTPVVAIGYPAASEQVAEPSGRNGRISGARDGPPFLEISAAVAPGMSGGPVVDTRGRLVGLVSRLPGTPRSSNLATAATTLTGLLRGKGIAPGLGPTDRDYRTGVEAYYDGEYDTAVEYLDAVLAAAPSPQARRLRDLAAGRGGHGRDNGLLVALIVACAGIAVFSGAAGVALLARRRRAAMAAPTPPYGFPVPEPPP